MKESRLEQFSEEKLYMDSIRMFLCTFFTILLSPPLLLPAPQTIYFVWKFNGFQHCMKQGEREERFQSHSILLMIASFEGEVASALAVHSRVAGLFRREDLLVFSVSLQFLFDVEFTVLLKFVWVIYCFLSTLRFSSTGKLMGCG